MFAHSANTGLDNERGCLVPLEIQVQTPNQSLPLPAKLGFLNRFLAPDHCWDLASAFGGSTDLPPFLPPPSQSPHSTQPPAGSGCPSFWDQWGGIKETLPRRCNWPLVLLAPGAWARSLPSVCHHTSPWSPFHRPRAVHLPSLPGTCAASWPLPLTSLRLSPNPSSPAPHTQVQPVPIPLTNALSLDRIPLTTRAVILWSPLCQPPASLHAADCGVSSYSLQLCSCLRPGLMDKCVP